jgi:hypothetical protein
MTTIVFWKTAAGARTVEAVAAKGSCLAYHSLNGASFPDADADADAIGSAIREEVPRGVVCGGMRNPFLSTVDLMVWPGKRVFPTRLLTLDAVVGGERHRELVERVLQVLDAIDAADDDLGRDPNRLTALVVEAEAGRLAPLERPLLHLIADAAEWPPRYKPSFADQFLYDFTAFGLREALAYQFACEPAFAETRRFMAMLVRGYVAAAEEFRAHAEAVRVEHEWIEREIDPNDPSTLLFDRLVLAEAKRYGSVWSDRRTPEVRGRLTVPRDPLMWRAGWQLHALAPPVDDAPHPAVVARPVRSVADASTPATALRVRF